MSARVRVSVTGARYSWPNVNGMRANAAWCLWVALSAGCGGATAVRGPATAVTQPEPGAGIVPRPGWETARGVVFDDQDGDGARGDGEAGVAGVLVSNGLDVVRTNGGGEYAIPVKAGQVLFVVKPTDYAVPTNEHMLPQFHYVHQPEGTPASFGFKYAGLAPTGPLPERIDFPLLAREEPESFHAILIADPQPQTDAEVTYVRDDFVAHAMTTDAAGAAFGITHGDIMFDDLSLLPRYNAIVGQLGVPWYNVAGNHELNLLSPDDGHSLDTFKRVFGPTYYAFEYAGALVLALDNVEYHGVDPSVPNGSGGYHGHISEAQLAFVRNLLPHIDRDKLVVVSTHIPLYVGNSPGPRNTTDNREALFALLCERKRVISFAGHTHTAEHVYFGPEDGCAAEMHHHILATVSGAWWSGPYDERGIPESVQTDGTPNGYYVLDVDGTRSTTRYVPLGAHRDHQMRIVVEAAPAPPKGPAGDAAALAGDATAGGGAAPRPAFRFPLERERLNGEPTGARLSRAQLASARVVVNVFDGGPRTTVAIQVDDRPPVPGTPTSRPDPLAARLYGPSPIKKSWAKARSSTHIWQARLPADLAPGAHRIAVTAIDDQGHTHRAARIFEVSQ